MKHTAKITLILVAVFLLAQFVGLLVINQYIDEEATEATGVTQFKDLPLNMERPEIEESQSYWFIIAAVLIGTVLVLLLVKFRGAKLWKFWFFIAATLCLTMAFAAFMNQTIAFIIALGLSFYKVFRPNFYVHNLTEIFLYGGLAAIFVPIMNLTAAVIVLLFIAVYDAFAVWQSKHMVKMAKFQSDSKVFAGLMIPYSLKDLKAQTAAHKTKLKKHVKGMKKVVVSGRTAILGGGDIGFPLLFAGVVLKTTPMLKVLIIPIVTAIALFLLLYFAKKDKFYPAMPFLTSGCLLGYLIVWLI